MPPRVCPVTFVDAPTPGLQSKEGLLARAGALESMWASARTEAEGLQDQLDAERARNAELEHKLSQAELKLQAAVDNRGSSAAHPETGQELEEKHVPEGVEAANGSGHHSILPAQQDKQQQAAAAQIHHLRSELERTVAAVNTERELREVRGLMPPCQL